VGIGAVAILILASLVLMVLGYRSAGDIPLYLFPLWAWHLNDLLMLAAIFMMDVERANGIVRTNFVIRSCLALSFGQRPIS